MPKLAFVLITQSICTQFYIIRCSSTGLVYWLHGWLVSLVSSLCLIACYI